MNTEDAVRKMIWDNKKYAVSISNKSEYLDIMTILSANNFHWGSTNNIDTVYNEMTKLYGENSVIRIENITYNTLSYGSKDYFVKNGYTVIKLDNISFIPYIMKTFEINDRDKINIIYNKDKKEDSDNPYTYTEGMLIDCYGNDCSVAVLGHLVLGNVYCKKCVSSKKDNNLKFTNGDVFYYVDIDGNVAYYTWYNNNFCYALRVMGNVFKTYKEAKDNKETIMKKYNK